MSFAPIGGISSATTKDGDDSEGESNVFLSTMREGREGIVGVRSGSTGRSGHKVMGRPVMGKGEE